MRFVVVVALGLAAVMPGRAEAGSFGALAGMIEAAREEVLAAEAVARRSSYRPRRYSSTRSAMRVSRGAHFTRSYQPRMAPPRTRW